MIGLLRLTLATAILASGPVRAWAAAPEDAAMAAVRELDALLVRKDAAGLGRLLAEDFVGAIPTGEWFRREAYVAYHCRPDEGLTSIEIAPGTTPIVRVLDDRFAVVNRRVRVTRKAPDGREQAFAVQRIEVLSRDGDRWRIVSGQGTSAGPLPPR
jgi:ketosteroid isomerase-like protein